VVLILVEVTGDSGVDPDEPYRACVNGEVWCWLEGVGHSTFVGRSASHGWGRLSNRLR